MTLQLKIALILRMDVQSSLDGRPRILVTLIYIEANRQVVVALIVMGVNLERFLVIGNGLVDHTNAEI